MGKKKNVQALAAAAAGSSGSADSEDITNLKARNVILMKEVKERRKEIQHLQHQIATATGRLQLTAAALSEREMRPLVAAGKKNAVKRELNQLRDLSQTKAKTEKAWKLQKKNVIAASVSETAESSESNEIENLKVLNDQLVKEVAERRKKFGRLRLEVTSLAADHDILTDMEREVFGLVISSSLSEAVALKNAEMAAVTQSASSKLNATETRLCDLAGEKDDIQRNMERIVEKSDSTLLSLEQAKNHPRHDRRIWKKWIYPVAVASFCVATAIVIYCKGSNVKN